LNDEANEYVTRLARGLTVAVAQGLSVHLTPYQTVGLYQNFRDAVAGVLGELVSDLAEAGELDELVI
jgi:hypothetical protein